MSSRTRSPVRSLYAASRAKTAIDRLPQSSFAKQINAIIINVLFNHIGHVYAKYVSVMITYYLFSYNIVTNELIGRDTLQDAFESIEESVPHRIYLTVLDVAPEIEEILFGLDMSPQIFK